MTTKTINCSVHGAMTFSQLAVAIIDTLEFQRLRWIGQVGVADLVYPSATHSRFEHSLGTAHLAKVFISEIARRQPTLGITDREIRCVELAGLCHDLGHGPFSHLWETFYKRAGKQIYDISDAQWHHELTSVQIFRLLLKRNRIFERFPNEINESDADLIEGLILGKVPSGTKRRFLYQIVNNSDSGLDVDKWDYFMRDAQNLGVKIDFEYHHVLRNLEVLEFEGESHVCFRDKCYDIIRQGFENRFKLHKRAYQHPKVAIMDEMLVQALVELEREAKLHVWKVTRDIATDQPTEKALNEYLALNDLVLKSELLKHSEIYRAMLQRSNHSGMYRFAGKLAYGERVHGDFMASLASYELQPDDVALLKFHIHMGKRNVNPMDHIYFFAKNSTRPERLKLDVHLLEEEGYDVVLRCSDTNKRHQLEKAVRDFQKRPS